MSHAVVDAARGDWYFVHVGGHWSRWTDVCQQFVDRDQNENTLTVCAD